MLNTKVTKEKRSVAARSFSEKTNATKCDAEAEDNKDSEG